MAADESEWLNRLLNAPGRGDFTNEEIDELFNRHASANAMPERAWPLSDARNRLIRRVRGGKAQLIHGARRASRHARPGRGRAQTAAVVQ